MRKAWDLLKSIASWLFGARSSSKGKEEAKADPDISEMLSECEKLLAEHGITDAKSWRRWALKNHPDKGGDSALFAEVSNCVDRHIKGSGIGSRIRQLLGLLKKANVKGLDKLFPGEMHAPLMTPDGVVMANYAGPGTQIKKRLKRGDKPVSGVDALAKRHDIAYELAASADDIRKADKEMLDDIERVRDESINKTVAKKGIGAKYALEGKTGVLYPSSAELRKNDPLDALFRAEYEKIDSEIKAMTGSGACCRGAGFLENLDKLAAKYSKVARSIGVTPQQAAAAAGITTKKLKEAAAKKGVPPAVIKAFEDAFKKPQKGGAFWDDLLRVVSFLPIPVVSDIARTISIAKTAVDTATGTHKPVLGGLVTNLIDAAGSIPGVGAIAKAGAPLMEMVGFGVADPAAAVKMAGDYIKEALSLVPEEEKAKVPAIAGLEEAAEMASKVAKTMMTVQKGSGKRSRGGAPTTPGVPRKASRKAPKKN